MSGATPPTPIIYQHAGAAFFDAYVVFRLLTAEDNSPLYGQWLESKNCMRRIFVKITAPILNSFSLIVLQ